MTKQEIQAYIDAEANVAADKHNADWAKTQPTFYNSETLVRRLHFLPGYKAGFKAGFDTGAELERKRAQVLVDLLKLIASSNRFVFLLGIEDTAKQAIEAYEKETAE